MAKIGRCVWGSWSDAGDAAVKYLLHSGGGREVAGQGWTMALGWREYQASLGSDATDGRLGPWHPTDQHCIHTFLWQGPLRCHRRQIGTEKRGIQLTSSVHICLFHGAEVAINGTVGSSTSG